MSDQWIVLLLIAGATIAILIPCAVGHAYTEGKQDYENANKIWGRAFLLVITTGGGMTVIAFIKNIISEVADLI